MLKYHESKHLHVISHANQLINSIHIRGKISFIYRSNSICGGANMKGSNSTSVAIYNTEDLSLSYLSNVAFWFSETNSNYLASRAHQDDSLICTAE